MAINLVSASPIEYEIYAGLPDLREKIDSVGHMIQDLYEENLQLDIVLAMDNPADPSCFTLAFSGTTLALDFYPNRIDVSDFNKSDGDEDEVIQTFGPDEMKQAAIWLVNQTEQ